MTKAGAIAILTTIMLGLVGWAGTTIVDHGDRLTKVETSRQYESEMLKEIRDDVKDLRKLLPREEHVKP